MKLNETVYYSSPVGTLLIKNSSNAIKEVSFLHKENIPLTRLAEIEMKPTVSLVLKDCIQQLDEYFAGKLTKFDVEIIQEGTAFQQQVWKELLNIQYGKTTNYLTLSKRIGNVKAIRAVGTANGKNNIAIIVPCHRVIGSNGDLTGYAGGLWRKQWLLEHEAKFANGLQTLFQ